MRTRGSWLRSGNEGAPEEPPRGPRRAQLRPQRRVQVQAKWRPDKRLPNSDFSTVHPLSREDWARAQLVIRRRPAATLPLESQGLHEVEMAFSWPEPAVCLSGLAVCRLVCVPLGRLFARFRTMIEDGNQGPCTLWNHPMSHQTRPSIGSEDINMVAELGGIVSNPEFLIDGSAVNGSPPCTLQPRGCSAGAGVNILSGH